MEHDLTWGLSLFLAFVQIAAVPHVGGHLKGYKLAVAAHKRQGGWFATWIMASERPTDPTSHVMLKIRNKHNITRK